jgi:hypothetical protein
MKANSLFTKAAAGVGSLALVVAMSACSHHTSMAQQSGQQTGEIRTEQPAATNSTSETLGTAPAPANTQAQPSNPGTPAVISGPAAVDNTGRVYTSSSVGSAGNASSVGTNTNVNITPSNNNGTVAVAETTQPAPLVTTAPAPAPVITSTTTTETTTTPAPVVTETPAPVVETPAPMTSSTTTETTTTTTTQTRHRRLRKD